MSQFKKLVASIWPSKPKILKQSSGHDHESVFNDGEDEDRRETGEEDFSVDIDLEERIIKEIARQTYHQDFNFAEITSANNEYSYLVGSTPIDFSEEVYSYMDKEELLFIDSKRICLANTISRSIIQMFLKREVDKISVLNNTVTLRRQKITQKQPCDLMLLDIRRFADVVPYLQLFWTNLL